MMDLFSEQAVIAIEGQVKAKNTVTRRRRFRWKRNSDVNLALVEQVLQTEFCEKVDNFFEENQCNVQILGNQPDPDDNRFTIVRYAIVIIKATSVTELVSELKKVSDGLGTNHGGQGVDFADSVVEGE